MRRPHIRLVALFLLLRSLIAIAQSASDPVLKSWETPRYPPLARQARIQGKVQLEFWVNHNGDVVSVNVLSGHPMLAPAATEYVKTWKFFLPRNASPDDHRYETALDFQLSDKDLNLPTDSNAEVVIDSFRHVQVIAQIVGVIQKLNCPSEKEKRPPTVRSTQDFVEMSRSSCYGTCPAYAIRVNEDGTVKWDGRAFVVEKGEDFSNISPAAARDLISKFASAEVWALCESYSQSATDNATTDFRVSIGHRAKTVSNYANSAPSWLADLESAVDETADAHRWLHGDPRDEPLSRIQEDRYGPKPGVTPLMRAAVRIDNRKVKALLKKGADPDQTDSSGWTALMYAGGQSCGEASCVDDSSIVDLLLAAGANPKYSSPHGDTPLMAAAFDRRFERALVRAGANVNAQNLDGVSALMILASFAEADQIQKALQAGADAQLKDAHGRTALDYLQLASCGQSPLRDSALEAATEYGECNALDKEDVEKSQMLLTTAMHSVD